MSKTKIVGVMMLVTAVSNTVMDIFNGGGFDVTLHLNDLNAALTGLGFVFLRKAIDSVK